MREGQEGGHQEMAARKRNYFEKLAFQHVPEMRLLFRGGKLWKKDEWRNIVEHQLTQVAAAKELSEALGLPKTDEQELLKVAVCHDWGKRLKLKPNDFQDEEKERAQEFLDKVDPDPKLMQATGPEFLEIALVKGESSFLQRLQFYLDDISKGSEIVNFDERVAEVESRRQDLNEDSELTQALGGRYWDKERELGHQVEQEIFERLKDLHVDLNSPKDIPQYLRSRIEAKINQI